MSVQFGIDASSFQGNVNWARTDATTAFGWEKVTQGSPRTMSRGYVNPFWAGPSGHNKRAMAERARASGFVPGGYLFLEAGDGAGQAESGQPGGAHLAGDGDGDLTAADCVGHVQTRFSAAAMARRYETVYRAAIESQRAGLAGHRAAYAPVS